MLIFTGGPLFIWGMGRMTERSFLKESLSILTILAFFQVISQFYLSRSNGPAVAEVTMGRMARVHNFSGYTAITILLIHPVLLVIPRFFESGVTPLDAFWSILTRAGVAIQTFTTPGVILGVIAWCLLLLLGATPLLRKILPLKYTTWRLIHGMLSALFIFSASWHVIDLGRHSNSSMALYIGILSASGVFLLLKNYCSKSAKLNGDTNGNV